MAKINFTNKAVFSKTEEKNYHIEINENSVIEIPLDLIDIGENIRDMSTDQELEELGQTIKEYGQLEPCIVHQEGERYVVEMGSRRYKACKLEDIPTLKCIVRPKFQSEKERIIIQAIENEHRRDMSSRERELYMAKLLELGMSQKEIANALHKNKGWINEALKAYNNYQKDKKLFDGLNEEISTRTMADTSYLTQEELASAIAKAKKSENTKKIFTDEVKRIKEEKTKKDSNKTNETTSEEKTNNTKSFDIFSDSYSEDKNETQKIISNIDLQLSIEINEENKTIKVKSFSNENEELNSFIKNQIRVYYLEQGYSLND